MKAHIYSFRRGGGRLFGKGWLLERGLGAYSRKYGNCSFVPYFTCGFLASSRVYL